MLCCFGRKDRPQNGEQFDELMSPFNCSPRHTDARFCAGREMFTIDSEHSTPKSSRRNRSEVDTDRCSTVGTAYSSESATVDEVSSHFSGRESGLYVQRVPVHSSSNVTYIDSSDAEDMVADSWRTASTQFGDETTSYATESSNSVAVVQESSFHSRTMTTLATTQSLNSDDGWVTTSASETSLEFTTEPYVNKVLIEREDTPRPPPLEDTVSVKTESEESNETPTSVLSAESTESMKYHITPFQQQLNSCGDVFPGMFKRSDLQHAFKSPAVKLHDVRSRLLAGLKQSECQEKSASSDDVNKSPKFGANLACGDFSYSGSLTTLSAAGRGTPERRYGSQRDAAHSDYKIAFLDETPAKECHRRVSGRPTIKMAKANAQVKSKITMLEQRLKIREPLREE